MPGPGYATQRMNGKCTSEEDKYKMVADSVSQGLTEDPMNVIANMSNSNQSMVTGT